MQFLLTGLTLTLLTVLILTYIYTYTILANYSLLILVLSCMTFEATKTKFTVFSFNHESCNLIKSDQRRYQNRGGELN